MSFNNTLKTKNILLCLPLLCSITQATMQKTFNFRRDELSITQITNDKGTFDIVKLNNCDRLTDDIGGPQLPTKVISFIIPYDGKLSDIKVVNYECETLPGEYNIFPLQSGGLRDTTFTPADPFLYETNYPGILCKVIGDGYRANFHLITLKIYPVQHCNKRLTLFTKIEIELDILPASFNGLREFRGHNT